MKRIRGFPCANVYKTLRRGGVELKIKNQTCICIIQAAALGKLPFWFGGRGVVS